MAQVLELVDDEVADALFALQEAAGDQGVGAAGDAVEAFLGGLVDDEVGLAGFVFQGDEGDALGGGGRCRIRTSPATR